MIKWFFDFLYFLNFNSITKIKKDSKTFIINTLNNDKLLSMIDRDTPMLESFREVDNVLRRGVQGIAEIVTVPGLINVDFADVRSVMKDKGTALMGIGIAQGPNRAIEATRLAISSPLLEIDINGATNAIVFITSDVVITMQELNDVMEEIRNASTSEIDIVCGTGFNIDLRGELIVTVIATGFDTPQEHDTKEEDQEENPELRIKRDKDNDKAGNIPAWFKGKIK